MSLPQPAPRCALCEVRVARRRRHPLLVDGLCSRCWSLTTPLEHELFAYLSSSALPAGRAAVWAAVVGGSVEHVLEHLVFVSHATENILWRVRVAA